MNNTKHNIIELAKQKRLNKHIELQKVIIQPVQQSVITQPTIQKPTNIINITPSTILPIIWVLKAPGHS